MLYPFVTPGPRTSASPVLALCCIPLSPLASGHQQARYWLYAVSLCHPWPQDISRPSIGPMLYPCVTPGPRTSAGPVLALCCIPVSSLAPGHQQAQYWPHAVSLCHPWPQDISRPGIGPMLYPCVIPGPRTSASPVFALCCIPLSPLASGHQQARYWLYAVSLCHPWPQDISRPSIGPMLYPCVIPGPRTSASPVLAPCCIPVSPLAPGHQQARYWPYAVSLCHPWPQDISRPGIGPMLYPCVTPGPRTSAGPVLALCCIPVSSLAPGHQQASIGPMLYPCVTPGLSTSVGPVLAPCCIPVSSLAPGHQQASIGPMLYPCVTPGPRTSAGPVLAPCCIPVSSLALPMWLPCWHVRWYLDKPPEEFTTSTWDKHSQTLPAEGPIFIVRGNMDVEIPGFYLEIMIIYISMG